MAIETLALSHLPVKPDRSKLSEYPTLSLRERDRRWGLIREMMGKNNVEGLIVLQGVEWWDDPGNYLTNEPPRMTSSVFFPLQGEPIAFGGPDLLVVDTQMKGEAFGIKPWIKDWRYRQPSGKDWVAILKERKFENSLIGIIGNGTFSRGMQTLIAENLMNAVRTALPHVTFIDLWKPFVHIMLVKDQEEIAMFRKAALALEVASEEFVLACKTGNTIADIENAFMSALIPFGIDIWPPQNPVCSIGFGPTGGRGISWMAHGLKPPVIRKGDLVSSELFANVGSLHAQVQITVSIGEPTAEKARLASLAREAYENGVKITRPGITFGRLAEALGAPNHREGAWHLSPLAHSLNPHEAVTNVTEGLTGPRGFTGIHERFPGVEFPNHDMERADLVLQEGMCFQFEPNSCYGCTYVNIGGNILVTKDGCEELNNIPTRMVVVPDSY